MIGRYSIAAHGQEEANQSAKWGAGQAADATAVCAPDDARQMGCADGGRSTGFPPRKGGSAADWKARRDAPAAADSDATRAGSTRREETGAAAASQSGRTSRATSTDRADT